jgi:signal transduction histidine kinase
MSASASVAVGGDSERVRIARELHDVIAYGFATISLQAGVALHVVDQQPEQALEALGAIKVASKVALDQLREILGMLRQPSASHEPTVKVGLDGLETLAQTTTRAGLPTFLDVSVRRSEPLPAAVGRAAYRIVQEALANVLRHADAGSASVSVALEDRELVITVEDDGVGQQDSEKPAADGSGYGIIGMRERATALGGDLEARPRPGGGFRVHASLPVSMQS